MSDAYINNDYQEWNDCEAPGINYDEDIASIVSSPKLTTPTVFLNDSSNSSTKTVEYNFDAFHDECFTAESNDVSLNSQFNNDNFVDDAFKSVAAKKRNNVEAQEKKNKKRIEALLRREKKKTEALKDKQKKSVLLAHHKNAKPEEVLKRITVHIDINVINSSCGGLVIQTLQKESINYKVDHLNHKSLIMWTQAVVETINDNENLSSREIEKVEEVLLHVIDWKDLVDLIYNKTLLNHIVSLQSSKSQRLTIAIIDLDKYINYQTSQLNKAIKSSITGSQIMKTKKSEIEMEAAPKLSKEEIEFALAEAQLLTNTCHRKIGSTEDLSNLVLQMSRSISQIASKREQNMKDVQSLSWYAKADSKAGVSVDKNGNGLHQLWQQQLCQFNNVGLEVAQAIIVQYKSPQSLLAAYAQCKDVQAAEDLLANLTIRREAGILSSSRKVGGELSRKIHRFITATSPNVII